MEVGRARQNWSQAPAQLLAPTQAADPSHLLSIPSSKLLLELSSQTMLQFWKLNSTTMGKNSCAVVGPF